MSEKKNDNIDLGNINLEKKLNENQWAISYKQFFMITVFLHMKEYLPPYSFQTLK